MELLTVRIQLIEKSKEIPGDMIEAVSSLVYAAQRITDLPELQVTLNATLNPDKSFALLVRIGQLLWCCVTMMRNTWRHAGEVLMFACRRSGACWAASTERSTSRRHRPTPTAANGTSMRTWSGACVASTCLWFAA